MCATRYLGQSNRSELRGRRRNAWRSVYRYGFAKYGIEAIGPIAKYVSDFKNGGLRKRKKPRQARFRAPAGGIGFSKTVPAGYFWPPPAHAVASQDLELRHGKGGESAGNTHANTQN